jgi:hypothetical protein
MPLDSDLSEGSMALEEIVTRLHDSECKESHDDVCTWKIEECFRDKWQFLAQPRWLREAVMMLKGTGGVVVMEQSGREYPAHASLPLEQSPMWPTAMVVNFSSAFTSPWRPHLTPAPLMGASLPLEAIRVMSVRARIGRNTG